MGIASRAQLASDRFGTWPASPPFMARRGPFTGRRKRFVSVSPGFRGSHQSGKAGLRMAPSLRTPCLTIQWRTSCFGGQRRRGRFGAWAGVRLHLSGSSTVSPCRRGTPGGQCEFQRGGDYRGVRRGGRNGSRVGRGPHGVGSEPSEAIHGRVHPAVPGAAQGAPRRPGPGAISPGHGRPGEAPEAPCVQARIPSSQLRASSGARARPEAEAEGLNE